MEVMDRCINVQFVMDQAFVECVVAMVNGKININIKKVVIK
jgi:hypothetical protein